MIDWLIDWLVYFGLLNPKQKQGFYLFLLYLFIVKTVLLILINCIYLKHLNH